MTKVIRQNAISNVDRFAEYLNQNDLYSSIISSVGLPRHSNVIADKLHVVSLDSKQERADGTDYDSWTGSGTMSKVSKITRISFV